MVQAIGGAVESSLTDVTGVAFGIRSPVARSSALFDQFYSHENRSISIREENSDLPIG